MKNIYIIGDVHGCYESLMKLISQLPEKEESHLVFVGDLIDRGPDSSKVVEFVKQGKYDCIMGNHEAVMLAAYDKEADGSTIDAWMNNGGEQTLQSYSPTQNSPSKQEIAHMKQRLEEHLAWMRALPNYLEFDIPDENGKTLFVTHGFGLPYWKNKETKGTRLRVNRFSKASLYGAIKPYYEYEKGYLEYPVFNVFGHDPQDNIKIFNSFAPIDAGCVYGGSLIALEWPSKKIFHYVSEIEKRKDTNAC